LNDSFLKIGSGTIFHVPIAVYIFLFCFLFAYLWQTKSVMARHMYAVGGNIEAARLSGVPVSIVLIVVYGINGLLTGLAGGILSARVGSGYPQVALGYELSAIAAVVMGGTSLFGGRGGVQMTMVGILIIGVMNNGLNLLGYPDYYQMVVRGIVIVFAVFLDRLSSLAER
jgi:ribose/xylose/arabinose/galactoside ABC-type transport system permease subunit